VQILSKQRIDATTMMGDEHVNPAVPKTAGALLAEEVIMDPLSPLPSFLEMKMIEEAAASANAASSLDSRLSLNERRNNKLGIRGNSELESLSLWNYLYAAMKQNCSCSLPTL
jgi:hypothetical protein